MAGPGLRTVINDHALPGTTPTGWAIPDHGVRPGTGRTPVGVEPGTGRPLATGAAASAAPANARAASADHPVSDTATDQAADANTSGDAGTGAPLCRVATVTTCSVVGPGVQGVR